MNEPSLFLTCMSGKDSFDNIFEMVEPLLGVLDGIVWILNDCPKYDPGARYLESVKGVGRIIYRDYTPRYWHMMNETLFTGLIDEGDFCIWTDPLERPAVEFLKRVKTEIGPMMIEADVSCAYFYGKPFLFRYYETLQYQQSPHWTLVGYPGRAIEWSTIEPNERKVRLNVRPEKRKDPLHWVNHFARYYIAFPAGSNTVALGLDHFPPGDRNAQFAAREELRLEFRREMKRRGFKHTMEDLKTMLIGPLDDKLKGFLKSEKILSDFWHHVHGRSDQLKDSHNPADAVSIERFI